MKIIFSIMAALALVLMPAPLTQALDTDAVTFTLVNGTDYVIVEFYASPPGAKTWEEDILGVEVLEPGDSVEITIDDSREDCDYDFLAIFEDETEWVHEDVAICDGEEYVYRE